MSIYQHFRPEEKEFIDQVLNWKEHVEDTYAPKLTDFLDPREQQILKNIIGQDREVSNSNFLVEQMIQRENERLLYPDYYSPNMKKIFNMSYLKLNILKSLLSLNIHKF